MLELTVGGTKWGWGWGEVKKKRISVLKKPGGTGSSRVKKRLGAFWGGGEQGTSPEGWGKKGGKTNAHGKKKTMDDSRTLGEAESPASMTAIKNHGEKDWRGKNWA